jgi:purine-binding chemotaxis protein CheW
VDVSPAVDGNDVSDAPDDGSDDADVPPGDEEGEFPAGDADETEQSADQDETIAESDTDSVAPVTEETTADAENDSTGEVTGESATSIGSEATTGTPIEAVEQDPVSAAEAVEGATSEAHEAESESVAVASATGDTTVERPVDSSPAPGAAPIGANSIADESPTEPGTESAETAARVVEEDRETTVVEESGARADVEPEAVAEDVEPELEVEDEESGDETRSMQVLEFLLSGSTYAVTIGEVGAIVEMKEITRYPRGPDAVDGVTDLRGEITAVLDPKRLLDIETDDGPSDEDYIVVLDRSEDKQKVAIRVDEVVRVETYSADRLDRNGDLQSLEVESLDANMIEGIVHKDVEAGVELVPWLNIDAIVDNVD